MKLAAYSYGKGRVRIMRVQRESPVHQLRELSVEVMLHGEFAHAYTNGDNKDVIATDTIKNIVNIVAREQLTAETEAFCAHLAAKFLDRYARVERVAISTHETRWTRLIIDGAPHPHGFVLDANGQPTVQLSRSRETSTLHSGIEGFTFLKSTGSGWADFLIDDFTTLPATTDRIAATSMSARWRWATPPAHPPAANATILNTMLAVFATTYSTSVQDSLFRMGKAALSAEPGIDEISMSCPNKHYLPINLAPFGASGDNMVFTPTDEPHGQIECTVSR